MEGGEVRNLDWRQDRRRQRPKTQMEGRRKDGRSKTKMEGRRKDRK